ncbi:MAG: GNAT family N-acetyltransferase [Sulfitobacter sp.]
MFDHAPNCDDHALMQDPAFAQALRLCGQSPITLPGGLTVLIRCFRGIRVAMLPRAAPPVDLREQLRAVGLARCPLILSPDHPTVVPRAIRLRRARQIAVMPLSASDQTRRAALHPKWRNQLKRAEMTKLKVSVTHLPPTPDTAILRAETHQASQRGYSNWPAPLTAAFAAAAPAKTHLFEAKQKGQTIASMLFLTHGLTATYHIGHITPQGRSCCAHNLLLWEASMRLKRQGYENIDLGQLHPQTPDLNRFKLRAGAQVKNTDGTYLLWHPFARR